MAKGGDIAVERAIEEALLRLALLGLPYSDEVRRILYDLIRTLYKDGG